MTFSASGRTSLARASVVLMRSLVRRATSRLFSIALVWLASVPSLRPFFMCRICRLLRVLQAEAHLLKLVLDLFDGLRPEVADIQQIVLGTLGQLTDRVD